MDESANFSRLHIRFQPGGCLTGCLIFSRFQPGLFILKVVYEKKNVYENHK